MITCFHPLDVCINANLGVSGAGHLYVHILLEAIPASWCVSGQQPAAMLPMITRSMTCSSKILAKSWSVYLDPGGIVSSMGDLRRREWTHQTKSVPLSDNAKNPRKIQYYASTPG